MKKSILALTVVGFIIGCGGGGSSTPSESSGQNGGSHQDGSQQQNPEDNLGTFEYPSGFKSFEDFMQVGYSVPNIDAMLLSAMAIEAYIVKKDAGAQYLIDKTQSKFRHSHCEKGSAIASNLVVNDSNDEDRGSSSGRINYTTSSGIEVEPIEQPDKQCTSKNLFIDGAITFDFKQHNNKNSNNSNYSLSATLGSGDSPFFFIDNSGYFNGSIGYIGAIKHSYNYIESDEDTKESSLVITFGSMEVFRVKSNINIPYSKGNYTKSDLLHYKNYRQTIDTNEDKSISTLSYELGFKYENKDFVLQYSNTSITENNNTTANLDVTLQVSGDESKIVRVTSVSKILHDGNYIATYTYTKDGKTETKSIP